MASPTRILLADDVAMFRDLGKVFLSRSGHVDLAACPKRRSKRPRVS